MGYGESREKKKKQTWEIFGVERVAPGRRMVSPESDAFTSCFSWKLARFHIFNQSYMDVVLSAHRYLIPEIFVKNR